MPNIDSLDRLKSQLLTSGLQQKNQPLYQVINQLIDSLRQAIDFTASEIANLASSIEDSIPVIPPTTTILGSYVALDGEIGEDGLPGLPGPPGPQGPAGHGAGRIYYLDPSNPSDIVGYFTALDDPSVNPETTIITVMAGVADNLLASFVTEPNDPNVLSIPAGGAFRHIHAEVGGIGQFARLKIEQYYCNADGTGETLINSSYSSSFGNSSIEEIIWDQYDAISTVITATQRIVYKLYGARVSGPANITLTVYFDGVINPSYLQSTISQGITGAPGPQGGAGNPGMPGLDGIDGIDGEPGIMGPQGFSGTQGIQGPPGVPGFDGIDGEIGADGLPGKQGLDGSPGIQGVSGPQGNIGPPGIDGDDSELPYMIPGPTGPAGSASPGGINTLKKTGDQTINAGAATFIDITDLTFPVVNGVDYAFYFYIVFRSAAVNTGWKAGINHPGGVVDHFSTIQTVVNAAAGVATWLQKHNVVADDMTLLTSTAPGAGVDLVFMIQGRYKCTTNGTFAARFANELAANTDIVVQEGSWGFYF